MSARKGRQGELELREQFREMGFVTLTIPGKTGTEFDFDDRIFGNGWFEQLFAAECKFRSRDRFYIQSEQLEALSEFARMFHPSCRPIVCVRWNYDTTWYARHVDELPLTDSGNASIAPSVTDEWSTLSEYVAQCIEHDAGER